MATVIIRPIGPGNNNQATPYPNTGEANWEDVCEEVADDDATYITNVDAYTTDSYKISNIAFIDKMVNIDKVTIFCKVKGAVGESVKPHMYESLWGGEYGYQKNCTGEWQVISQEYTSNPMHGRAWESDDFANTEIGVFLNFVSSPVKCTQVWIEVEYQEYGKKLIPSSDIEIQCNRSGGSTNYENVINTGDDYIYKSSNGSSNYTDIYGITLPALPEDAIISVIIIKAIAYGTGVDNALKFGLWTSIDDPEGTLTTSESINCYSAVGYRDDLSWFMDVSPFTEEKWTLEEYSKILGIGIKLYPQSQIRVTKLWAEVYYTLPDTTPPVITLIGDPAYSVVINSEWVEPGYDATDDVDGNITNNVVVGGDEVNTAVPGTYVITYNVSDAALNPAEEKTRTVYVGFEILRPVANGNINQLIPYPILTENWENVDEQISDDDDTYNYADNNCPLQCNEFYTLANSVHQSMHIEKITIKVIAKSSSVNDLIQIQCRNLTTDKRSIYNPLNKEHVTTPDTYELFTVESLQAMEGKWNWHDLIGMELRVYSWRANLANTTRVTQAWIEVEYSLDTDIPVITLNGSSTIRMNIGDEYNELGATAIDAGDGDISDQIEIDVDVDWNEPGTYEIYYNVEDSVGNRAETVVRTLILSEPGPAIKKKNPFKIIFY